MPYCINPDCSQRENPDNCAVCQNCQTPLILQNRYRIIHPLQADKHSYTEVFEIEDLINRDQPKILKSLTQITPDLERLFEQEALILTTLRHPGLPVGEAKFELVLNTGRQLHCFIMEKIPGKNLQVWLSKNHYLTSYKTALDWLKQLTHILQFVHEQKYFHRDIKPANIMLRPDGKLVLIDFGTARKLTQTVINSRLVTIISSIGYTAPEQSQGNAVVQSDFYALGRTFIYLLTGIDPARPPQNEDLRNWTKYIKDRKTPKKFILLIQAMTDYHPEHRPSNAQVILDKITQIEKHPQVQWQKLLLTTSCAVFLIFAGQKVYQEITISRTCKQILGDHISCGEESLIPSNFWGNGEPPLEKQLGIEKYRQQNFAAAEDLFTKAFQQEADAETLIYLNNAKIQRRLLGKKIYTIAVAVPLERRTAIGLEILRGAAEAQTKALEKGQLLRIIIADDSNRQNSNTEINDARKIAQQLVKYDDLLAVVGHYSSEATKQTLSIYSQAKLPLISATSTSTSDDLKSPFFFRTIPSNRIEAEKMANYVFTRLKQRQIAIFYAEGSDYAKSLEKEFKDQAKFYPGKVIDHQPAFNLASPNFDAKLALNQAQNQGATAIVLIPDAGVGKYDAIENAQKVIQSNVNQLWIIAGDSLYSTDLLTSNEITSSLGIKRTAWVIPWYSMQVMNSQTPWKIDISWRTATSYDAVLVLSQALKQNSTRLGIPQVLANPQFSLTGATGLIRFKGGDRQNGKITIVKITQNCHSRDFVFTPSDRSGECQEKKPI